MINVFDEMGINYYRNERNETQKRNDSCNEKLNESRKIYLIINIPINSVNELPKANAEHKYWCARNEGIEQEYVYCVIWYMVDMRVCCVCISLSFRNVLCHLREIFVYVWCMWRRIECEGWEIARPRAFR